MSWMLPASAVPLDVTKLYNKLSSTLSSEASAMLKGFYFDLGDEYVNVDTADGSLRGSRIQPDKRIESGVTAVDSFLGVPYAQPPVGPLRFKASLPPKRWSSVRNATRFGPACPQRERGDFTTTPDKLDEDCLYLNIYAPFEAGVPSSKLYPVMVYIHGGSYRVGTGSNFVGNILAQFGVVVVTINYRLEVLGFLSTREPGLTGNYGLLDQIEALKWIQKNIKYFRGDPDLVTVLGNSAGGASVGILNVSPAAAGLFKRVIIQSGPPLAFWAVHEETADMASYTRAFVSQFGCYDHNITDLVTCLRAIPWQQFLKDTPGFQMPRISPDGTDVKPVVDGVVLPTMPRNLYARGRCNAETIMAGTVDQEMTKHVGGVFLWPLLNSNPHLDRFFDDGMDRGTFETGIEYVMQERFIQDSTISKVVLNEYTDWSNVYDPLGNRKMYINFLTDLAMLAPTLLVADHVTRKPSPNIPVYLYTFELDSSTSTNWQLNYHQLELEYIFGTPFTGLDTEWLPRTTFTTEDQRISLLVMTFWSNFAKFGNPSGDPRTPNSWATNWTQYRTPMRDYLRIVSDKAQMEQHLRAEKITFWNRLIPELTRRVEELSMAARKPKKDEPNHPSELDCYDGTAWLVAILMLGVAQLVVLFLGLAIFTRWTRGKK